MARREQRLDGFSQVTRVQTNLLIIYDDQAMATQVVRDHLAAFRAYSRLNVFYYPCRRPPTPAIRAGAFGAILIHFSARLPFEGVIHPDLAEAIGLFGGLKIAMPQDEYDRPFVSARRMRDLGVHVVFTTVGPPNRDRFYPPRLIGSVDYFATLTGYMPEALLAAPRLSHVKRPFSLVYRGNPLPVWYGALGREKQAIGLRLRAECVARDVSHDIQVGAKDRIHGRGWAAFVAQGRTMCASESGSNVLDGEGRVERAVNAALAKEPGLGEAYLYDRFVRPLDGLVTMNQISPKIFEAIAMDTGLVLFEGRWSGLLEPNRHYIPLRKDFSNIDEVFERLAMVGEVEDMAVRTRMEVGLDPRLSYRALVEDVDNCILDRGPASTDVDWTGAMTAVWSRGRLEVFASEQMPLTQPWALPGPALGVEMLRELNRSALAQSDLYLMHAGQLAAGVDRLGVLKGRAAFDGGLFEFRAICERLKVRARATARAVDERVHGEDGQRADELDLADFCEQSLEGYAESIQQLDHDYRALAATVRNLRRQKPLRALIVRIVGRLARRGRASHTTGESQAARCGAESD